MGTRLVSGNYDGTVTLWNTSTGEEVWERKGIKQEISSLSFSPDGSRLITRVYGKGIELWDASTGTLMRDEAWLEAEKWMDTARPSNENVDGLLAIPSGRDILLVNPTPKDNSGDKARRAFKFSPKSWWHKEQLVIAEASGNAYSATFHAAWLLTLESQSHSAYDALHRNYEKLELDVVKLTSPVVVKALGIPEPPRGNAIPGVDEASGSTQPANGQPHLQSRGEPREEIPNSTDEGDFRKENLGENGCH